MEENPNGRSHSIVPSTYCTAVYLLVTNSKFKMEMVKLQLYGSEY